MNERYQLSILLPSAPGNTEKLERFLKNVAETITDFSAIEIVICLDSDNRHEPGDVIRTNLWVSGFDYDNLLYVYARPSKFRGSFFDAAWKASTGRFMLLANDDMIFKTKGWDQLIPYNKFPDDLVVFGFKDNVFNERFFCHPIWSRKAMELGDDLFGANYQITKCDNTVWDIHPPNRRIYLPDIEIDHLQTPYGPEWQKSYDEDNGVYLSHENVTKRNRARKFIEEEIGMTESRVMIGVPTAEYARRADFYDHLNLLDKPANSVQIAVHGQSIARNRNIIVEQALINNCTHVFFLDDDVLCKPDTLYRLLAHGKNIISALQLKRNYPHQPIAFDLENEPLILNPNVGGVIQVASTGLGACLIHTNVFKGMTKPWFRLGEEEPDQMSEDTGFFQRAYVEGIAAYCDLDTPVGHIGSMSIWPEKVKGTWYSTYDTQGTGRASVPQFVTEIEPLPAFYQQ